MRASGLARMQCYSLLKTFFWIHKIMVDMQCDCSFLILPIFGRQCYLFPSQHDAAVSLWRLGDGNMGECGQPLT